MNKKSLFVCAIVSCFALASCNSSTKKSTTTSEKTDSSKLTDIERAKAILNSLITVDTTALSYISDTQYKQHNLLVGDGKAAFEKFQKSILGSGVKLNVLRAFEDNGVVVLHNTYEQNGKKSVGFDLFRFKDGKATEHWDNAQPARETPSGHTMYDGQTEVIDIDKTDANKALVKSFVTDFLINGDQTSIDRYINNVKYIQHSPDIADNISGLKAGILSMKEKGIKFGYEKIHHIFGQGNFVLVISESKLAGNSVAIYDLFRVENQKISEHWDVIEQIPNQSKWANKNGKF